MKKFLYLTAAVVALSFMSCTESNKYLDQAQDLAKQLNEGIEKQDTAAVLALDKSIQELEDSVVATGDSAIIADFREAVKESRLQAAPMITVAKIKSGVDKEEAVQQLVDEALEGGMSIGAITSSIDAALQEEGKKKE